MSIRGNPEFNDPEFRRCKKMNSYVHGYFDQDVGCFKDQTRTLAGLHVTIFIDKIIMSEYGCPWCG